ncbi:unnamed protein product [Acanthoscelides obtectus]|uniref:Uncharacterized protein n=1 Tax=Acanthoscelides obtectus TaxID=200917 RepID=A0A9P0K6W9_ACAOB|nr:unnamed protein product [Acanthoscelides obtectus]CAK1647179.1 hypothetical protein AOBTE_LOCUS15094 [Acanthoscelides obtectus]
MSSKTEDPDGTEVFCEVKCELDENVSEANSAQVELCENVDYPRRNGLFSITENLKMYRIQGRHRDLDCNRFHPISLAPLPS